jgi:hypothetical protein
MFNREFGESILCYILNTSINEAEESIRQSVRDFRKTNYTDAQLYDFINDIGKIHVDRVKFGEQKVCIGNISGFTQALCELDLYYKRPQDGVRTELDIEEFDKKMINKVIGVV